MHFLLALVLAANTTQLNYSFEECKEVLTELTYAANTAWTIFDIEGIRIDRLMFNDRQATIICVEESNTMIFKWEITPIVAE